MSVAPASTTASRSSSTCSPTLCTARSSCTPAPASRRPSCRTRSARRSTRTTCSRTCSTPTSTARSRSRSRRSMPRPPPSTRPRLQRSRQINAVIGLVGAPIVFLGLAGWAFFHWRRFGKDPVYLDDPSVLMPAPPPDLTAASGAMVMDGGTSRRALTTAMLDLASRGLITFREDGGGILGLGGHKVGVDTNPAPGSAEVQAQRERNARRPIGPAEEVALQRLAALGAPRRTTSSAPRTCRSSERPSTTSIARSRGTSSTAAGSRSGPARSSRAGWVVASWRSSPGSSRSSRASTSRSPVSPCSVAPRSRAGSPSS